MDRLTKEINVLEMYLDCYGNFDPEDCVCKGRCAINIRCAIEKDENVRAAILEDLVDHKNLMFRIQ